MVSKIHISFIVIARNAKNSLPHIFQDVLAQDYPLGNAEIVLVDGRSEDESMLMMKDFKDRHPELTIKIFDNPKKTLAPGWNIALANSAGDVILRVDAHSRIPKDFLKKNSESIAVGQEIVGGHRVTIIPQGACQQIIGLAEISKFGAGSALYRNAGEEGYVDTLAHAAYRRRVFETVGGYDERLARTEDNEMHYRMKKAGFRFYYNPEIKSFHTPRGSLGALLKQKYSNGFWIGLTLGIQPRCFNLRHFIPLCFVLTLIGCALLGIAHSIWRPFMLLVGFYLIPALFFSFAAMGQARVSTRLFCLGLPVIFLLMHLSYGLGILIGLARMPYFVWKNRNYAVPFPIKPGLWEN